MTTYHSERFYKTCKMLMERIGINYEHILQDTEQSKQGELYYKLTANSAAFSVKYIAGQLGIPEKRVRYRRRKYIDSPAVDKRKWKPKRLTQFWEI